jgi:hypothetical protein
VDILPRHKISYEQQHEIASISFHSTNPELAAAQADKVFFADIRTGKSSHATVGISGIAIRLT